MVEYEAIESIAKEPDFSRALYGFKPGDVQQKFFIGEAILIAGVNIFLIAFFKGVNSALEKRGEELGEKITNWFVDKLEGLFRKPEARQADEAELKKELHELARSASKLDKNTVDSRLDAVEGLIKKTLIERGSTPGMAGKIAKKTREASEALILEKREGDSHGTKRR